MQVLSIVMKYDWLKRSAGWEVHDDSDAQTFFINH